MNKIVQNVIISGFPRAGTTSCFRYLSAHPRVCGSRVKELNFFVSEGNLRGGNDATLHAYLQNFSLQPLHTHTLEASPVYTFEYQSAAKKIYDFLPNSKIIFLLRNPVARFVSYFQKQYAFDEKGSKLASLADTIEVLFENLNDRSKILSAVQHQRSYQHLILGKYVECLAHYATLFDKSQMLPLFLENLSNQPLRNMEILCAFLGIQPDIYSDFKFAPENQSITVKSKAVYRLALNINAFAEPVLNRFPVIRKSFRDLHHRLNIGENQGVSEANLQKLRDYYLASNARLQEFVLETYPQVYSPTDLPAWLRG